MKLVIFGATGATGQCLVELALAQGHDVTAFARNPLALTEHEHLSIVRGDMFRPASVETAVFHLTANCSYPLMVLFSFILLPAMIVRFYQGWFQVLYLDLPLCLGGLGRAESDSLSSSSVSSFPC